MTVNLTELSTAIVECLQLGDVDPADITLDTTLFTEGLGLDSIDVLELVVAIEQRWGVRIDNKELGQKVLISVGTLLEYINSNRGDAKPA